MIGCVNKSHPRFKILAGVYSKPLAEAFVRGYTRNVKGEQEEFYYPTLPEIKAWLTADKRAIPDHITRALRLNPTLSVHAIRSLLTGVIHEYNGEFRITTGPIRMSGVIMNEVRDTIYRPNLEVMKELQARFPRIFQIRYTHDEYVKKVIITPVKEGEQGKLFQKREAIKPTKASRKTIAMVKDLIQRIGVDIQAMNSIKINGVTYNENAVALIMQKLIMFTEGREDVALPEEAMHFVVEILKQKNPAMYRRLLSEINNYRALQAVFADYGNDPNYQTKEGKPDVAKLKDEAIAKVLAETVIAKNDEIAETPALLQKSRSWWQAIVDFLRGLFRSSGFDKVAMDIITGRFEGTVDDIKAYTDKMYFQKSKQDEVYDHIKEVASRIIKKDEEYYIDGKKIKRRVSNLIKSWYDKIFQERKLLDTDHQKAIYDLKAEKGTAGHAAFEYAFSRLVDENGYIRETPLDDNDYDTKVPKFDRRLYEILRDNLKRRLESLDNDRSKGRTRFMSEATVYDPTRDIAGTIDFLAIKPDGKVNLYDWKFMDLNTETYDDVPWYKVNAWNQQMAQYKLILQNGYRVKSEDFEHTRMIPILAIYSEVDYKKKNLPTLMEIKIGGVDIKDIEESYLLPVGLQQEKTGDKRLDQLLEKLNAVYEKMSSKKVNPEEKRGKAEQLNSLYRAIRQLHIRKNVSPLVYQSQLIVRQAEKTIEKYKVIFLGKDPKSFSEQEISDFSGDLLDMVDTVDKYSRLDAELESIFSGELTAEDKELMEALSKSADKARRIQLKLDDTVNEFVSEIIAKSEDVSGLLSPEKIIKGISRLFVTTSGLQLKAIQVLYKKANRAFAKADFDTVTENKKLLKIKEAYDKWAKARGLSSKNYFDIIKKKNKNELIDEFDPKFYSELQEHINQKDFDWIRDNVRIDEYSEFLSKYREKEIERILNKPWVLTEEAMKKWEEENILPKEVKREVDNANKLYSINGSEALGWLLYMEVRKFPKRDKWESKEWKELNRPENKPARDFYGYITEINERYKEIGYIKNARVFLPYIRKNFIERVATGGNLRLGDEFFRSISVDESDIGYGQIDPFTGKPINTIPKYFTTDPGVEVSEDLFRTISMYNEAAIRYKYLDEIEDQVRALVAVEGNKKAIATSMFGRTEYKDGELQYTSDNNQNSKLIEDTMKVIIYGQKYIQSETFDQLLFKLGTWGKTFNEKLGMKIFPEDLSERQVSINKGLDQMNTHFQLTSLGLNLLSATSNLFGGTAQSIINSGKYFLKSDYVAAEKMIFMGKFNGTDRKKMIGALEYFMPLTHNYNREIAKKLSLNSMTQESLQDFLMILMRNTDLNVQTANFYAFLKNAVVIDGKIVNAREYIRSLPQYQSKYSKPKAVRDENRKKFEEDVTRLIEEKGVLKLGKVENDEFTIPGVDRNSESVIEFRRKVQQLSKDALGNLSVDDIRMINANIYGKSFMVFKNWIPRLLDLRYGNLKYNSGMDAYEWGRTRTVMRVIGVDLVRGLNHLYGAISLNDSGIENIRKLYETKREEYKKDTGKELEMTEDEFIDLVHANVKAQMFDALVMTAVFLLVVGLKAAIPDDDEDPAVTNQWKFMAKAADKFQAELSYFYDFSNLAGVVSTGIFPSMSLVRTFRTAVTNFMKENWGLIIGDDELREDTKVIKYWMRTFPLTNQVVGYLPMFYPELAKDLGIRVSSNYSLIR